MDDLIGGDKMMGDRIGGDKHIHHHSPASRATQNDPIPPPDPFKISPVPSWLRELLLLLTGR